MMVGLYELENMQLAQQLIRARLRLSVIRALTDVSTLTLRQWWHDIHGVRPANGKLPETVLSFIKDADMAARISSFAVFYKRLNGTTIAPGWLLNTWMEYQRICGDIDINAGYFAVRDVRAHIVMLSRCDKCRAGYIYDTGNKYTDQCPFCQTKVF
jgi:hypothetical protein